MWNTLRKWLPLILSLLGILSKAVKANQKSHTPQSPSGQRPNPPHPGNRMSEDTSRAQQLTNLFENGDFDFHYDYIENLDDGRGFTAGRAGFTTATGDFLQVVEEYTKKTPNNPLAQYLDTLRKLAKKESDDVDDLDGIEDAWKTAARDPAFCAVQDSVVNELYLEPAERHADELGLQTPLARAAIYDTIIQHGEGDDPDSLGAIIKRTNEAAGGTPASGVDEKAWLATFIETRRAVLEHAHDKDTREVWRESVGRCDVFASLAAKGNYDLSGPLRINAGGFNDNLA